MAEHITAGHGTARHGPTWSRVAWGATVADDAVTATLEHASGLAARRGAPDGAAELAELSVTMTPAGHPHDVCRRSTITGEARFAAGDSVRALELFADAAAVAAVGPELGDVLLRSARVHYHHDDIAASRRILGEARREAGDDAVVSSEWVLVGGQMVLLHAIEHGAAWPRVSMDLDVIVNARVKASVRGFVAEIEALGFALDGMSPELDVLAPEGLGERTDLTTTTRSHAAGPRRDSGAAAS